MPLHEFWSRVRAAVSWSTPHVIATSASIPAPYWESEIERADLWLTPGAVAGFNGQDFDFLDEAEREKLAAAVDGFLGLASRQPPDEPATANLARQARPYFLAILDVLQFGKYRDSDAFRLGKQLERSIDRSAEPLASIRDFRFETGPDHMGEPSWTIYIVVADEVFGADDPWPVVRKIREAVMQQARDIAPDLWPFIHFQTVAEQAELLEPDE